MSRIALIPLILSVSFHAFAQEEDLFADEFELLAEEDVVIAAAKHKQKIGFSPSQVIVITRQDIYESGAANLSDLLRQHSSLFSYMMNPAFPQHHARGNYRILVMLDGREMNLELLPQPFYHLIPVRISEIERIEIVMGPNSALYGANAVAAVINVMTRKPSKDLHTDLSITAGQNGATILGGRLEGGTGPWSFSGSFGLDQEGSWMSRDVMSRQIMFANGRAQMEIGEAVLAISAGILSGEAQVFSENTGNIPIDGILVAHTQMDFEIGDLKTRAYYAGLRGDMNLELDLYHPDTGIVLGTLPTVDIAGDTAQIEAQYDLEPFAGNLLIGGADCRYTQYRSNQTVDPRPTEIRFGVFLHDEQTVGDWLLITAGARFDWNSKTSKTEPAISPQLALVFNLAEDHYIRLAGGTAFRKPTLVESSANFKIDADPAFPEIRELFEEKGISNPDLDNEILGMVEVGYLGTFFDRVLRIDTGVYYGFDRHTIVFISNFQFRPPPFDMQIDVDNSRIGYVNMSGGTNNYGAHLDIQVEPLKELTLFLRLDYEYRWRTNDDQQSRFDPSMLASAGGILRLPLGITLNLSLIYLGTRVHEMRDPDSMLDPFLETEVPADLHLLATLLYRIEMGRTNLDLGLNVFHLFGGRYRESIGVTLLNGSNFGCEVMGTQAMLTARLQY
jgi:outer membrane receptor for ferrienterochelin and colicin